MLRYLPILLLAGFAAEIASIIWVGRGVGVFATLMLMGLGFFLGVLVFRTTGASVSKYFSRPSRGHSEASRLAGATLLRFVAGGLLILPGFFSDFIAGLLLMPPIQTWLVSRMKVATVDPQSTGFGGPRRDRTIIEGEAFEIEGDIQLPGRNNENQ